VRRIQRHPGHLDLKAQIVFHKLARMQVGVVLIGGAEAVDQRDSIEFIGSRSLRKWMSKMPRTL